MNELRLTHAELLAELATLRRRVAELEARGDPQDRHRIVAELMSDYVYSGVAYSDGIAHTDWVSGAFERILGYTLDEVQALPGGFGSLVMVEDLANFARQQPRLFMGEALATR